MMRVMARGVAARITTRCRSASRPGTSSAASRSRATCGGSAAISSCGSTPFIATSMPSGATCRDATRRNVARSEERARDDDVERRVGDEFLDARRDGVDIGERELDRGLRAGTRSSCGCSSSSTTSPSGRAIASGMPGTPPPRADVEHAQSRSLGQEAAARRANRAHDA